LLPSVIEAAAITLLLVAIAVTVMVTMSAVESLEPSLTINEKTKLPLTEGEINMGLAAVLDISSTPGPLI